MNGIPDSVWMVFYRYNPFRQMLTNEWGDRASMGGWESIIEMVASDLGEQGLIFLE